MPHLTKLRWYLFPLSVRLFSWPIEYSLCQPLSQEICLWFYIYPNFTIPAYIFDTNLFSNLRCCKPSKFTILTYTSNISLFCQRQCYKQSYDRSKSVERFYSLNFVINENWNVEERVQLSDESKWERANNENVGEGASGGWFKTLTFRQFDT